MLPTKETELTTIAPIGPVSEPPRANYERLIVTAKEVPPATTVVVHPCDETSLRDAAEASIIKPVLVGPAAKIANVARQFDLDIARYEVVEAPHSGAAASRGVKLIHEGQGELLMKGSLHTDELMREVTSVKTGLRTARRISHVFNIFPDLDAKRDIIQGHRSVHANQPGHAARRYPFGCRDGDDENPLDHRCGRAVQDGRAWADHRRSARRAARLGQRH